MAQINIIKPRFGEIKVLDSNPSSYTVRFHSDDEEVTFTGFNVFCHACGRYLYTSSDNPSVFDIQRLIETGHPGPFDISAGVEVESYFGLSALSMDDTMGSASPTYREIPCKVGDKISYTITASPNDGYRFVKWVSSTGQEFTSATVTISVTVKDQFEGRRYYAYFEKIPPPSHYVYVRARNYDTHIDSNGGSGGIEGVATAYYEHPYYGTRTNIARLHTNKIKIFPGQQVTISAEMLQSGLDAGYKFYGWRSNYLGSLSPTLTFVAEDHDYSFRAIFIKGNYKTVNVKIDSKLYGDLGASSRYDPQEAGVDSETFGLEPAMSPDGSVSSGWSSVCIVCPESATKIYSLMLYLYRYYHSGEIVNTFASNNAFVHGTSSSKVTVSGSTSKEIVIENPDDGDDITIYLCTHLLVHKADGQNLESKPPQLLYDCNKPE